MAFVTIEAAETEAKLRVAAGTYLQAYGCRDRFGVPAIYFQKPIGASGLTTDGRTASGSYDWAIE
jgi:hypothetical protein